VSAEELLRRHAGGGAVRSARAAVDAPARPRLHTVVVTCMDARLDPVTLFGLQPGDVHVLRNAGGVVTDDVVRSIAVSQRKLGTSEVLVVQHTGCGMATFTDESFVADLEAGTGHRPSWRPGTFADPVASVAAGLARLRDDPFVRSGTAVRGFVVDIASFALQEVAAAPSASPAARRPARGRTTRRP
jgi:carbonic anhydrase